MTAPETTVGEHTYRLNCSDTHGGGWPVWRWQCACGSVGRWTGQSADAAFHGWQRHIERREAAKR